MLNDKYMLPIEICNACAIACDQCAITCLKEDSTTHYAESIESMTECSIVCRIVGEFLARDSMHIQGICRLGVEVCESCARECAKHKNNHCQQCAETCVRCANEIRALFPAVEIVS